VHLGILIEDIPIQIKAATKGLRKRSLKNCRKFARYYGRMRPVGHPPSTMIYCVGRCEEATVFTSQNLKG
jgi:hypothetical protein